MNKFYTVAHRLSQWAETTPDAPAQRYRKSGEWKTITAREFADRTFYLALYLESKGFTSADVSAIFSYNCPQWVQMDIAPSILGGKSAGLYPNSNIKDVKYILSHTESKVLGVQNKDYYEKTRGDDGKVVIPETCKLIIAFDGDASFDPRAVRYEDAIAEGKKIATQSGKKLVDYLGRMNPDQGAFLIYTSGTTGNPKGVLLSNRNFLTAADIVIRTWALPEREGSTASFLPLCHIAEKLQNLGAGITQRYVVNYLSSIDKIAEELPQVEPTLLLCVPRLWEKMIEGVNNKLKNAPAARRKLAHWAFGVGGRVAEAKFAGKMPNPLDLLQYQVADRLVLGKIRKALGLGARPLAASGAAPLHPHVAKWFRQLGIEILECYGLSESAAVICLTLPGVECTGTVGKPVAGMEFKIADDGEILARGDNIFLGYYKNPEETEKVLTKDGWLHTGDLGELDERGMVRIRGRKREILKTSGGKMVAPLPIEEKLKEAAMISQVCMVGDNRKYFSALITLSESTLKDVQSNGGLAKGEVVVSDPAIMKQVQSAVDQLNEELASFEQIKRFTILGREFSVVDGEMTPTLKMKRNVIEKRFQELIDRMYN